MTEDRPAPPVELLTADSFRVRANPRTGAAEARALEEHFERFRWAALESWCGPHEETPEETTRAAAEAAALAALYGRDSDEPGTASFVFATRFLSEREQHALDAIDAFLEDARSRIAAFGEGWPRIELWGEPSPPHGAHSPAAGAELRLSLRPLPELHDSIELRSAGFREFPHPERKGPNIARYAELNRELGAEAVLTDARGYVREGTTTSLVWWPRGDAEHHGFTAPDGRRVPSITEGLLLQAGGRRLLGSKPNRRRGAQPQPQKVALERLAAHEVWAVNALHGIRVVTSIEGRPLPDPDERRLKWYREALDRCWAPIVEPGMGRVD